VAEIPKNIAQFVARDLVFITGGAGVLASVLYWLDRSPIRDLPSGYLVLVLGISYAVGFATQEAFHFLCLVTTKNVYSPNRILVWMFERYDHSKWPSGIEATDDDELRSFQRANPPEAHWYANHQRVITHMMIGATLAPCAFISGVLVLLKCIEECSRDPLVLGVACILLSLVLWPIGWLKAMQMTGREVARLRAAGQSRPT